MSVKSASFLMLGWVMMVTVLNFLINNIWILIFGIIVLTIFSAYELRYLGLLQEEREIQIKIEAMEFISVLIEDWREKARKGRISDKNLEYWSDALESCADDLEEKIMEKKLD